MRRLFLFAAATLALTGPAALAGDVQTTPTIPSDQWRFAICPPETAVAAEPAGAVESDDDACTKAADPPAPAVPARDPLFHRFLDYTQFALKHRVAGLASYYASFFDGRKTANGETFRNGRFSAAHLTLPLGTWVEVKSRATGRKLRLKVNDRGPYAKKFVLDLSQAAARFLGVDVARDRYVEIRVLALPGEEPPPEDEEAPEESAVTDNTGRSGR